MKLMSLFSIILTITYLIWRALFTLNPQQLGASLILYIADLISGLSFIGMSFFIFTQKSKLIKTDDSPPASIKTPLSVDVFIATYNEDLALVRRTALACREMKYPHQTYILDDGQRPEFATMAKELGIHYLSRTDRSHSKAGNLNHALQKTNGDLVVNFDADFLPTENFLTELIPYFEQEDVGAVQIPQHYYNLSNFQSLHHPLQNQRVNEQDIFFNYILPLRENKDAAFWIGTNAILRRKALNDVGGVATESLVEDMLTSIKMNEKKWTIKYVNKPLAFGIAPNQISQYLSQRLRWSQGAAQILRFKNPLFSFKLKWSQAIGYFFSILHFFEGVPRGIYYFFPALFLLLGISPVRIENTTTLSIIIGFIAFQLAAPRWLAKNQTSHLAYELFSMSRFLIYAKGFLAYFTKKELTFVVTKKKKESSGYKVRDYLGPALVFTINFIAILYGGYLLKLHMHNSEFYLILFCVLWCVYFCALSLLSFFYSFNESIKNSDYFINYLALFIHDQNNSNDQVFLTTAIKEDKFYFISEKQLSWEKEFRAHFDHLKNFPFTFKIIDEKKNFNFYEYQASFVLENKSDFALELLKYELQHRWMIHQFHQKGDSIPVYIQELKQSAQMQFKSAKEILIETFQVPIPMTQEINILTPLDGFLKLKPLQMLGPNKAIYKIQPSDNFDFSRYSKLQFKNFLTKNWNIDLFFKKFTPVFLFALIIAGSLLGFKLYKNINQPTYDISHRNTNDDWLSTDGNRIINQQGKVVRIIGTNWFGFETPTQTLDGLWAIELESGVKQIANLGFNLVRLPLPVQLITEWVEGRSPFPNGVNYQINPKLKNMTSLEILDRYIYLCGEYGIKVMLDMHRVVNTRKYNRWVHGPYTENHYFAAWKWIAQRYKNDDTVIAADLFNEPHGLTFEDGDDATIWDESSQPNNFRYIAEKVANMLHEINPHLLIMVEGIQATPRTKLGYKGTRLEDYDYNWWGGNLRGVHTAPVKIQQQNKLVYEPHEYGPLVHPQKWFATDFDRKKLYDEVWNYYWFFIHEQKIAPILIGEWGGILDQGPNQKWMNLFADFIVEHQLSYTFWSFNPNSHDTGGLVKDDWKTIEEEKMKIVYPTQWRNSKGQAIGLDHKIKLGDAGLNLEEGLNSLEK